MSGFGPLRVCGGVVAAAGPVAPLRGRPCAADLRTASRLPPDRRAEHLAARALLRRLLAEVIGPDAARSPLAAREKGQPYLTARPDIGVSLSHADGWVAAAVHPAGRVGVDVQGPIDAGPRMLRRCCTPSARATLADLPAAERAVEFAWIWSVQEACVKTTGGGIADLPWTVPVEVGQRRGRWRTVGWSTLRDACPVPVSVAHRTNPEVPCRCSA